nr:hypothetical protein [Tanacetum cinerariifolium]
MTHHHGTVAAVEGSVQGSKKSVRGSEKSVQGSEKKSILEADVAQCDWRIKNITTANDEIRKMTQMHSDLNLLLVGALN